MQTPDTTKIQSCQKDTKPIRAAVGTRVELRVSNFELDCRRTAFLVQNEIRRFKFSAPEREVLELCLDYSLRNGHLDALFQKQNEVGRLIGMRKNHLSQTIKGLIDKGVLIRDRERREPQYKQAAHYRLEIVLDSKRWETGGVTPKQPLTPELLEIIERVYRRTTEQFQIPEGDRLHDAWQRVILEQSRSWLAEDEFQRGVEIGSTTVGSGRSGETVDNSSPGTEVGSAAPERGADGLTSGVHCKTGDGPAVESFTAGSSMGSGSEGSEAATRDNKGFLSREETARRLADLAKEIGDQKSSPTVNFSPDGSTHEVRKFTGNELSEAEDPKKFTHSELFKSSPTSPKTEVSSKLAQAKSEFTHASAPAGVPVPPVKQETGNSLGNSDRSSGQKSSPTVNFSRERWRYNPNGLEKRILEAIGEFVGIQDVRKWGLQWLNAYVRKFRPDVIECAIEDCKLTLSIHGPESIQKRRRNETGKDIGPDLAAYLKGTIFKRQEELERKLKQ